MLASDQNRDRTNTMTTARPAAFPKISALITDVDGSLLTKEKVLTASARAAVAKLHAAGLAFGIISSRPPRGLRMLIEPLQIRTAIAGFNGGVIATPELAVLEQHRLSPQVARRAVDLIVACGAAPWVFSGEDWFVLDAGGAHVRLEVRTVQFEPTEVKTFGIALKSADKIVAVSADAARLSRCESEVRAAIADGAAIARSQLYYLDITPPLANKGAAVSTLSKRLDIPLSQIAVIGDGGNDVPMFERAGLSIAMGNASAEVQRRADVVTGSNDDEGFAKAVERYLLDPGRAEGVAPPSDKARPSP
jgi:Cof subfamily protein (haloacid dehalogenase superfamily)